MKENQVGPGVLSGTVEEHFETPGTIESKDSPGREDRLGDTAKARRGGRISKEIPILLFGHDSDGRVFKRGTVIEIAVPYAADVGEAPAIFVKGRIVKRADPSGRGDAPVGGVFELSEERIFKK